MYCGLSFLSNKAVATGNGFATWKVLSFCWKPLISHKNTPDNSVGYCEDIITFLRISHTNAPSITNGLIDTSHISVGDRSRNIYKKQTMVAIWRKFLDRISTVKDLNTRRAVLIRSMTSYQICEARSRVDKCRLNGIGFSICHAVPVYNYTNAFIL